MRHLYYNNRSSFTAPSVFDATPVTIFVDAIDSLRPHSTPGCTILNLRSGVTEDVAVDYYAILELITRGWIVEHIDFTTAEPDGE